MQAQTPTRSFSRRPFMEQRYGQRIALGMKARIRAASGEEWIGVLRDASISGGFMLCDGAPTELANISTTVANGAQPGREFVLQGCVVRIDETGFAIEWQDMACPQLIELLRQATHGKGAATRDSAGI